jgi:hypothetical protein
MANRILSLFGLMGKIGEQLTDCAMKAILAGVSIPIDAWPLGNSS